MSDYIPPELIPNILARLEVADVLRCTSVCKSWYVLITSSSFISLHLKLSTPNQESRLLVKYVSDESDILDFQCKVHLDNQTFDEIAELQCPHTNVDIIGSINGLFCLTYHMSSRVMFLLWNPSLRKSFTLPELKLTRSYSVVEFGFGFLPETNDYKVVKLFVSDLDTHDLIQVEIYELSTNCWRNVSVPQVSYVSLNYDPAVFLEGSLHWAVGICHNDGSGNFGKLIVSFDLKNENLGALSIPNCLDNNATYFSVSAVKESLCLLQFTGTHYDIWVMKEYGIPDSWTRQYSINVERLSASRLLRFRKNGEFIIENSIGETLLRELLSYNPTSDGFMKIGECGKNEYTDIITTYMESLALIDQELKSSIMNAKLR